MINNVANKTITGVFGDDWAPTTFGTTALEQIRLPQVGLSTQGHKVINWLTHNEIRVDNVMFFSDSQIYSDLGIYTAGMYSRGDRSTSRSAFEKAWNQYKQFNPASKIYMFDLSSYGTTPIDLMQKDVYMVCGWSSNIFKVLGGLQDWKSLKRHVMSFSAK